MGRFAERTGDGSSIESLAAGPSPVSPRLHALAKAIALASAMRKIAMAVAARRTRAHFTGQTMNEIFVMKKSLMRMAIDVVTTVAVVALPTPSVPPRVRRP